MDDKNQETELWRNKYSNESDAQLIDTMQSAVSHSARHIAAKQLLAERQNTRDEKKHKENMIASSMSNRLSILAIIVALIALFISVFK